MIKNICFFIDNFDHAAGTERCTALIANGLNNLNYKISIISCKEGLHPKFQIDNKINLISLGQEKIQTASKFKYRKTLYNSLKTVFRENHFDLVIVVDVFYYAYFHFLKRKCSFKVIAWEHFNCNVERGKFTNLSRWLAVKSADKIVVLGKGDLQNYKNKYKNIKNLSYIYNPIAYKITNEIDIENKRIIAAGRLEEQKGFDRLIDIWKIVEEEVKDWELNIYGEGSLHEELQDRIDGYALKNIKLCGHSDNIDEAFNQSSIFVLTSRYEGFGLVLLEAQAKGLPCIGFDCKEGPAEIIDNGVNGFLIENGNIKEFAEKLIELIKNKDLRREFSLHSQKDLDRFEVENVLQHWECLIESLNN